MFDSAYQNPMGLDTPAEGEQDPQQAAFEEAALREYKYCMDVATVFKSQKGKDLLAKWRAETIESSAWMPSIALQNGLEAANAHAYAREGQNAFVKAIENCIEVAHKCKSLEDFYNHVGALGAGKLL